MTEHQATGSGVDLSVDPVLESMIDEVLSGFSGPDVDPDHERVWRTLREVGLARLTAPEDSGGSGAGWVEAAAVLRAAAAAGVAVPFAETDLLAGPLRRAAGIDDSSDSTATVAVLAADGTARSVPWAGATDTIVCVRRTGDGGWEAADIETADLTVKAVEAISAIPTGDVTAGGEARWASVAETVILGHVMRGALVRSLQCIGAMEGMLDLAIAHTTERNQFGRALAKFQSVQNLVVDLAAETVLARAAVDAALTDAVTEGLTGDRSVFRMAVARSVVSQALAVAVRNVHQVHGAIGTTHEHTLHRRTLPALQWRGEFGSASLWEAALTRSAIEGGMDGAWPLVVEGADVEGVAAAWLESVTGS
ncbi:MULTISPECIES: acyl-CoA dehydrogenase family protein [unclassified Dietzia]|uniref:acyl-CoA dehydrogenase family protein n=1 Tax=unclassified Dietzia TaxID=2617939 RepID=UPI0015FCFBDB|nr:MULTISPECIES: acyl-CoA dehydrogenase family protein [unclassified Dietzia]MBB1023995.1 acyl-CoA/acyl-ACP dehydrogenase [Dietzia sp. DQ12-76]MBB1027734.1 acyl-CoA/acyl-ACP dehydrogenase [Dietzia sp. DQ11-38-2]